MSSTVAPFTLPEVVVLSPKETDDGRMHEALRSTVWFPSEEARSRCDDAGATFEVEQDGRTFYGAEVIYYLD
jgi:hypothetical protein